MVSFFRDSTRAVTRWFPLLAVSLLVVACSGDRGGDELPPGVAEGSPSIGVAAPTASAAPTTQPVATVCANEEAVAGDPARQIGASTSTDVDGDGAPDEVKLASDPQGTTGCIAFVAVETATGDLAAAPVWELGTEGGLPQPRVHGFVDIDGRAGDEILVDEAAGASTQFVGAFVYLDGSLRRVTVEGGLDGAPGSQAGDLFPYGGSVGHIEAVDCIGEGSIVISSATPSSDLGDAEQRLYEIERRVYAFNGAILEREDMQTHRVPIDELDRFPEYSSSPFGSC